MHYTLDFSKANQYHQLGVIHLKKARTSEDTAYEEISYGTQACFEAMYLVSAELYKGIFECDKRLHAIERSLARIEKALGTKGI